MGMHTWFECKIRYEKVVENGMQKKVTEPYLVDALSFTEAEARIIEETTPFISGVFTVSDIKRANYSEIFPSDAECDDRWFKCKLCYITLDDKSGAEKKTSTYVLVQASDLERAKKNLDAGMKGTMADYQVPSVVETAIMDVYPYTACRGGGGMSPNIAVGLIRRLTPTECARLQTIPSWYKWECSDTQQYRMLGNGWTVDVIVHILSFMKEKMNINVA